MSRDAQPHRPRVPRLQASLLAQVLTLVFVSLLTTQGISLAIVLSVPPPPAVLFRVSEVVSALNGAAVTSRDGVPLTTRVRSRPPQTFYVTRFTQDMIDDLARRLKVKPEDVVYSSQPFRYKLRHVAGPLRLPSDASADHVLIAPFAVALKQADGRWLVAEPQEPFPTLYQRRVFLWLLASVIALAPVTYLFARRLSAPIRVFAGAAERLGRDPRAAPLKLEGPYEVRQAASAFNQMQERLSRYVDDRTAMVGAVAHDLRTPLTRLRFRVEGAPPGLREKMVADMDEMDAMISSALAFVRDATQPFQRERLELSSLVESLAVEAAETGRQVTAESAAPVVIHGDPIALRRLVSNLLDNAVKFGGQARALVLSEGDYAIIQVDDDGPGVAESERERVFEPFQRGEPSRSRETGGVGLGLAVVRSVARAHGGEATLVRRPGGGGRAQVTLPL